MIHLRGITWDHPRGLAPLQATAAEYQRQHPDIAVSWDVRSLKEFGDVPLDRLCERYDLVMLDHPFIGTGVQQQLLIPLDEWLPADYLADQERNSVGPGYRSYTWAGHQWALAADVAGHVAAYRPDLVDRLGVAVPRSWDDVLALAAELPPGHAVAMPLVPTDAVCSFISLSANIGGPGFWDRGPRLDPETAAAALALMQQLLPLLHPGSVNWNPPQTLEQMSTTDAVVYVPLLFGYSNYARPGFRPRLVHFTGIPSHQTEPVGGILGGVGLGISAFCTQVRAAADHAAHVCSGACQRGLYFGSGGQPGHRLAWTDPGVNGRCSGFFQNTLATLDRAYLRPRLPGFNAWQEPAGEMIRHFLLAGGSRRQLIDDLNRLYARLVSDPGGDPGGAPAATGSL